LLLHDGGQGFEAFLDNLREVFGRLRETKLFVKPSKCALGVPKAVLTGHTVDCEGKHFEAEKLDKVLTMDRPLYVKGLKSFLGLTNWFQAHVKDYSKIAKPLSEVLKDYDQMKHTKIVWTKEREEAYEKLKLAVNQCPKLYFLNNQADSEIILETDASDYAIGAYLYQRYTDVETRERVTRPIGFMSKTLSKTEIGWSTFEKEGYAIIAAVRKWHHLLGDRRFTLRTDHKNLTYIRDTGSTKVLHWKHCLMAYDFDIVYLKGEENVAADAFSRLVKIDMNSVREAKGLSPTYSKTQLEQLNAVWEELDYYNKLDDLEYLACMVNYEVEHVFDISEFTTSIPQEAFDNISAVHNGVAGHMGQAATWDALVGRGLHWMGMRSHIRQFIKQCPTCQKNSGARAQVYSEPFTLATLQPMQKVAIDTIGPIEEDEHGFKYILVVIDHFTRWTELMALKTTGAEETAEHLVNFFGRFGFPDEILTDNGTQFRNNLMKELVSLIGSRHTTVTPYSKEENGIVERQNKEVMRHLRNIIFDKNTHVKWGRRVLPMVQRILNSSKKRATGVSPAQLLFGDALTLERNIFVDPEAIRKTSKVSPSVTSQLSVGLGAKHFDEESGVVLSDAGRDVLRTQRELIALAQKHQLETDSHHIVERRPTEKLTEHPIGSYVLEEYADNLLRRGPAKGGKSYPILHGPVQVIGRNGNTYTVRNLITLKDHETTVNRLKPYLYDAMRQDPKDAALRDENEFEVEEILKHVGDKAKRTEMMFLVKWKGYPLPEDNSWEPWKNLRLVGALHKYLALNNMKSLIPKNLHD
jgi:transposase InsO family protein